MAIARKFGDRVYKWHVPDLQAAAVGLPVTEIPTARFDLDVDAWFGEACSPTIANVVAHMKRIRSADLGEPILLSMERQPSGPWTTSSTPRAVMLSESRGKARSA